MNYKYFEAFLDSVLVIDQQLRLVYCNQAASGLCGIDFSESKIGQPLNRWISFENGFLSDPKDLHIPSGEIPQFEVKMRVGEGPAILVKASAWRMDTTNTEEFHWVVVIREMAKDPQEKNSLQPKDGEILKNEQAQTQLEQYSKNLEFMVRQRTIALNKANLTLKAILNSLGQGILVFTEEGTMLPIVSKSVETLFELPPPYLWIHDMLRIENKELETFKLWLHHLFNETIPFESVKNLGPRKLNSISNRHIMLDYFPIRNDDKKITSVVLVATDKTEEFKAREEAEKERKYVKMVLRILRNRRQFKTFLKDAHELITIIGQAVADLKRELNTVGDQFVLDYSRQLAIMLRALHTLKGGAATFSISNLTSACHEMEDWLVQFNGIGNVLMREEFDQIEVFYQQVCNALDDFLKQNGEIIGTLGTGRGRLIELSTVDVWRIAQDIAQMDSVEARWAYFVREVFAEPIMNSLAHFDEVVLNTATALGKQVSPIIFKNTEIKILPEKFSGLFAALVHAFRNAVDHGIESPQERKQRGKPAAGLITVNCGEYKKNNTDWIKLEISDDGAGIDPNIVRRKMAEKGLPGYDVLSDEDVIQSVFLGQFSTRDEVTEISGRGVGMDAIKFEVEKMGGWVRIHSTLGKGSKLEIHVPNLIDKAVFDRSIGAAA